MGSEKEMFLSEWSQKFPGVEAPNVNFQSVAEVEQSLTACKRLIKEFEEKLNREKFLLIYLQTNLASRKRTYNREKWGFNRAPSSSVGSESDPSSPTTVETDGNGLLPGDERTQDAVADVDANSSVPDHDMNNALPAFTPKPVKLRQDESDVQSAANSNRLSKVLENVKMFEARSVSDTKEPSQKPGTENVSNATFPPRSSVRGKRSSYMEVWECKTGAEKEHDAEGTAPSQSTKLSQDKANPSDGAVGSAAGNKQAPQVDLSQRRKDYVEVWTCNTGNKMSIEMMEKQDSFREAFTSMEEDMHNDPDYDLYDIDMTDGYGKRHYTMAGSDVKLRNDKGFKGENPINRMTWPAAAQAYEEDDDDENMDNADLGSFDLSDNDNDHSYDSQQSDKSQEDLDGFADNAHDSTQNKSNTFPEVSPMHRLRRARTTNERISATSAYSGWSDDDRLTDRMSLLSVQSSELHSSDEERDSLDETLTAAQGAEAPEVEMGAKDSTDSGAVSHTRPKGMDIDAQPGSGRQSPAIIVTSQSDDISHEPPKNREAVSDMVDYHKVRSIAEAEKLRMRRWVLQSVLDNEEVYLQYLNTLLLYMKPLKATIGTSQPVMSAQDFDNVFFRVNELHDIHASFYENLKPRLDVWSADTGVGDLFKKLLSKLNYYGDYVNNYKRAQQTVEKCAKENQRFAAIIESLKVQARGAKDSESITLVEVLYKPVERVMRTTLVLQDLLKHTPHRHPDYQVLRQVLKHAQNFFERINSVSSSSYRPRRVPSSAAAAARSAHRELIKDGFLVEVASDGSRKLRHCFLYSDLLLCAKQKSTAGVFHSKDSYECKWYIPLADLSFQPKEDSEAMPEVPLTSDDELRDLSNRAQQVKRDIAKERKRHKKEHGAKNSSPVRSRQEERLRKKLAELEARIVLAAPDLPLRIYHMQGRSYMFLMSSDYERVEWTEAIMKQQESCFKSFSLTSLEVNSILSTCVRLRKMNNVGSMLIKEDEDLMSGYINVTIHSGQGFLRACNPYCTLEVDSFGQFQTKAKTRPCRDTDQPEWNEEFEVDLDGAQTLRILCYDRARDASAGAGYDDDVLIAKGKVPLLQESLRGHSEWNKERVLMNEISILVSIKFTPRERSLQRLPSTKKNGVFGVKIEVVAKRESSGVPSIVRKCVAEVERRGMNEVGIYRVSGVASEIQALKASFDTHRKEVGILLGEVDINAVAGVLKLYFRELPEPLFTDARYNDFVEASSLKDPETKERTIMKLLSDLPVTSYKTLVFMRNHLINVSNNEAVNKMNLHNLATVFGPTLLRPAEDGGSRSATSKSTSPQAGTLHALRLDVHYQMDVLLYCLELNEMPDHPSLTAADSQDSPKSTANDKRRLSQSAETLSGAKSPDSSPTHDAEAKTETRGVLTRSVTVDGIEGPQKSDRPKVSSKTVVPPPAPQQRYHPYEEITLTSVSFKNPSAKPSVSKKPSTGPKPTPAPRKSSVIKHPQPVITDL